MLRLAELRQITDPETALLIGYGAVLQDYAHKQFGLSYQLVDFAVPVIVMSPDMTVLDHRFRLCPECQKLALRCLPIEKFEREMRRQRLLRNGTTLTRPTREEFLEVVPLD
jgi:hypothetical protein